MPRRPDDVVVPASGPATIPQLRAVVAPAPERNWREVETRYDTAEYHRWRNIEARESHRRSALRRMS